MSLAYIAEMHSLFGTLQVDPPKELIELLKEECDGGNGEFDKYLPDVCAQIVEEFGGSYSPILYSDKVVKWVRIS